MVPPVVQLSPVVHVIVVIDGNQAVIARVRLQSVLRGKSRYPVLARLVEGNQVFVLVNCRTKFRKSYIYKSNVEYNELSCKIKGSFIYDKRLDVKSETSTTNMSISSKTIKLLCPNMSIYNIKGLTRHML